MHCIQQHNEDRIQDEVKRESRRKKKIRSKFLPYKIPIDRFTSIIDVVKIDWDYSAGDGKAASPLKPSITMNCEQNGAHSYNSNASQSAIQPSNQPASTTMATSTKNVQTEVIVTTISKTADELRSQIKANNLALKENLRIGKITLF